jgi:hypothetical protein
MNRQRAPLSSLRRGNAEDVLRGAAILAWWTTVVMLGVCLIVMAVVAWIGG